MRELDGVSSTTLSTLYTLSDSLCYHYIQPSLKTMCVKFTNSGLGFSLLHFSFSFSFLIFLFLEHRVRVRSQDTENEVERSRTNDIRQHGYYMLTSCSTYSHLE